MIFTRRFFSVLSDEYICRAIAKSIAPIDKLLSNKFNISRKNIDLYGDYMEIKTIIYRFYEKENKNLIKYLKTYVCIKNYRNTNTMDLTNFYKAKDNQTEKTGHEDGNLPDMSLSITKLKPLLNKLSPDKLKICSEREKTGKNRVGIYKHIRKLLNPKSRKSCETPPEELIVAMYLLFGLSVATILCDETSLRSKIQEAMDSGELVCKDNLNGYISNVIEQGNKSIDYLKLCEKMDSLRKNTRQVIIAGKIQTSIIPELDAIHKSFENKAKTIKSDLYIKDFNGDFIGFSIKKDKKCQDTNFSVMSFFDHEAKDRFIMAKTEMMKSTGITPFTYVKDDHRDAVNRLLLDRKNVLWEFFRSKIAENPLYIGKRILQFIYGTKLPYPIMKFNGSELLEYSKDNIREESVIFEEHEPFYGKIKNGKARNTAKMFYLLKYDQDTYRVEIRFKGNHGKGTSPQFLAYSLK
jgi:hypothetical protein